VTQNPCLAKISTYLLVGMMSGPLLTPTALAIEAQLGSEGGNGSNASTPLIGQMSGEWSVRQRMWPGPAAKPVDLPTAVAHRVVIGDSIVQEIMTLAPNSSETPFTRVAYFDYNPVTQQYEYFSLDTRAPQMMNERSRTTDTPEAAQHQDPLTLYGSRFVAAQWGESKNVPFRYKIVVGRLENQQQTVRLYLTPLSGADKKEFLAFEYVYSR
jgi:Protein of unknown function (DUF1579)